MSHSLFDCMHAYCSHAFAYTSLRTNIVCCMVILWCTDHNGTFSQQFPNTGHIRPCDIVRHKCDCRISMFFGMYSRMVQFPTCMVLGSSENDRFIRMLLFCQAFDGVAIWLTSLPHGHDRNNPAGHGPQSPLWHLTLHRCRPHSYKLLHIFSHDQIMLLQSRSCVLLPHIHFCWLFFVHGEHCAWQTSLHVCIPHASNFKHCGIKRGKI